MDGVDIRILRTMGVQPYGRNPRPAAGLRASAVARRLKLSPEAVRERVARMEAAGVIAGYEVFPNFRHLRLEATCFYLRLKDRATVEAVARKLQPLEGLVGIYTFTEPEMCINLCYRSPADLERKLKVLVALAGDGEFLKFYDLEMPPVARALSSLDWRILKALRGNALRPLAEVAKELRVSTRTVKRRFDRMSEEGSFFIIPIVDPAQVPGLVLYELVVWVSPEAGPSVFQSVARALDERMVCVDYPANPSVGNFGIGMYATRLGEIEENRKKAAAVRGVSRVRPFILQGSEERFEWLDEAIDERVRETRVGALAPPA